MSDNLINSRNATLNVLKKHAKDPYFACKLDEFFSSYSKKNSNKNLIKRILYFLYYFALFLRSIPTIFKSLTFSQAVFGSYIIDKHVQEIDFRSQHFESMTKGIQKINFIHSANPLITIKNIFFFKNPFYLDAVIYFASLFVFKKDLENLLIKKSKIETKFFKLLLKILNIKGFFFIDDFRHTGSLRLACKQLGIRTLGYQHARFNDFHLGILGTEFDFYILWNDYFKEMLLSLNKNYLNSSVFACGHPRISPKPLKKDPLTVLIIEESVFKLEDHQYLIQILRSEGIKILYKTKDITSNILKIENVQILSDISLERLLEEYCPNFIIGAESTVLIESWLYNIPSFGIEIDSNYGKHFYQDGLLDCFNQSNIKKAIIKYRNMSLDEIELKKEQIWSYKSIPSFKDILRNFINANKTS